MNPFALLEAEDALEKVQAESVSRYTKKGDYRNSPHFFAKCTSHTVQGAPTDGSEEAAAALPE